MHTQVCSLDTSLIKCCISSPMSSCLKSRQEKNKEPSIKKRPNPLQLKNEIRKNLSISLHFKELFQPALVISFKSTSQGDLAVHAGASQKALHFPVKQACKALHYCKKHVILSELHSAENLGWDLVQTKKELKCHRGKASAACGNLLLAAFPAGTRALPLAGVLLQFQGGCDCESKSSEWFASAG